MTFPVAWRFVIAIVCLVESPACRAQVVPGPENLCRRAIAIAEGEQRIPDAFLSAIAKVESGRPLNGMIVPWPWTINAEGVGSFFATREDAITAVSALQARGVHSIDIGCMQVNLQQHPDAFHSLDQAFDPTTNARVAAPGLAKQREQQPGGGGLSLSDSDTWRGLSAPGACGLGGA
jgi:hypothetical protein